MDKASTAGKLPTRTNQQTPTGNKLINMSKGKVNKITKAHNSNQSTTISAKALSFKASNASVPVQGIGDFQTFQEFANSVLSNYKNAFQSLNLDF